VPETLRQVISRGSVDPMTALGILSNSWRPWRLTTGVASSTGHSAENIAFAPDGRPAFADSSVARVGETPPDSSRCRRGIRGPRADLLETGGRAHDVFAWAVVAYEMLTGRHPFGASVGLSADAVANRILYEAPFAISETALAGLRAISRIFWLSPWRRTPRSLRRCSHFLDALTRRDCRRHRGRPRGALSPSAGSRRVVRPANVANRAVVAVLVVVALVMWLVVLRGGTRTWQPHHHDSPEPPSPRLQRASRHNHHYGGDDHRRHGAHDAITTTTTMAVPTRSEETDSLLVYAGDWSTTKSGSASGGSFSFATPRGLGDRRLRRHPPGWIAKTSPAYGKANVTLDGRASAPWTSTVRDGVAAEGGKRAPSRRARTP